MANMFNINSDDFIKFTNKLEKMHRSNLPIAIRETLNNTAFKMKGFGSTKGQIGIQADKEFDYKRSKNLFKFMTGVQKAKGFDIGNMVSEAGIVKKSGKDELAEGLAQQQKGGKIKSGATPLNPSRTGKNVAKKVRKKSYLSRINTINLINKKGKEFVAGAIRAHKAGRDVLLKTKSGEQIIATVKKIVKKRSGIQFKMAWLYRVNRSGTVKLQKKRPFINRAAVQVMKSGPKEFEKQANKRIKKDWEK